MKIVKAIFKNRKNKKAEPNKPFSYKDFCLKEKKQIEKDGKMVDKKGNVRTRWYG
jgi:hypothetical protein